MKKAIAKLFTALTISLGLLSCTSTEDRIVDIVNDTSLSDQDALVKISKITMKIVPASIENDSAEFVELEDGGYALVIAMINESNESVFESTKNYCEYQREKMAKIALRTLKYGSSRNLTHVRVILRDNIDGEMIDLIIIDLTKEIADWTDNFYTVDPFESDEYDALAGDAEVVRNAIIENWIVVEDYCNQIEIQ